MTIMVHSIILSLKESVSEERDNHFQDTVLPIVAKVCILNYMEIPNLQ